MPPLIITCFLLFTLGKETKSADVKVFVGGLQLSSNGSDLVISGTNQGFEETRGPFNVSPGLFDTFTLKGTRLYLNSDVLYLKQGKVTFSPNKSSVFGSTLSNDGAFSVGRREGCQKIFVNNWCLANTNGEKIENERNDFVSRDREFDRNNRKMNERLDKSQYMKDIQKLSQRSEGTEISRLLRKCLPIETQCVSFVRENTEEKPRFDNRVQKTASSAQKILFSTQPDDFKDEIRDKKKWDNSGRSYFLKDTDFMNNIEEYDHLAKLNEYLGNDQGKSTKKQKINPLKFPNKKGPVKKHNDDVILKMASPGEELDYRPVVNEKGNDEDKTSTNKKSHKNGLKNNEKSENSSYKDQKDEDKNKPFNDGSGLSPFGEEYDLDKVQASLDEGQHIVSKLTNFDLHPKRIIPECFYGYESMNDFLRDPLPNYRAIRKKYCYDIVEEI